MQFVRARLQITPPHAEQYHPPQVFHWVQWDYLLWLNTTATGKGNNLPLQQKQARVAHYR